MLLSGIQAPTDRGGYLLLEGAVVVGGPDRFGVGGGVGREPVRVDVVRAGAAAARAGAPVDGGGVGDAGAAVPDGRVRLRRPGPGGRGEAPERDRDLDPAGGRR